MLPDNEFKNLLKRVNKARNFPTNTCAASRHVENIAVELASKDGCQMLKDDPVYCAESILAVVAALYEARSELELIRND